MRKRADCFPGSIGKNLPLRRRAAEKNRDRILLIPAPCGVSQPLLTLLPSVKTPIPSRNPTGVVPKERMGGLSPHRAGCDLENPSSRCPFCRIRAPANNLPGWCHGTTPSGLWIYFDCTQGSATAAQPWAFWQNPFGIPGRGFFNVPVICVHLHQVRMSIPMPGSPNRPSAFRDGPFQSSDCGATGGLAKRTR